MFESIENFEIPSSEPITFRYTPKNDINTYYNDKAIASKYVFSEPVHVYLLKFLKALNQQSEYKIEYKPEGKHCKSVEYIGSFGKKKFPIQKAHDALAEIFAEICRHKAIKSIQDQPLPDFSISCKIMSETISMTVLCNGKTKTINIQDINKLELNELLNNVINFITQHSQYKRNEQNQQLEKYIIKKYPALLEQFGIKPKEFSLNNAPIFQDKKGTIYYLF